MRIDQQEGVEQLPTGIGGLDTVLRGGFPPYGVYLVEGEPGAGKTVLAAQLCFNHVRAGGRALYLTLLVESPGRMVRNLASMRFFDADVVAQALTFIGGFRTLKDEGLPGLLALVRREVQRHGATLLVIDGFMAIDETAATDREVNAFVQDLQMQASLLGFTAFLTTVGSARVVRPERAMADGILELTHVEASHQRLRRLEVKKLRAPRTSPGRTRSR